MIVRALLLGCASAAVAAVELSPEVDRAVERYREAEAAIEAERDEALAEIDRGFEARDREIREDLIADLEDEVVARTRAGELDVAKAIRDRVDALRPAAQTAEEETEDEPTITLAEARNLANHLPRMSQEAWNELPGATFEVDARRFTDTGIELDDDARYLLLPDPHDRWGHRVERRFPGRGRGRGRGRGGEEVEIDYRGSGRNPDSLTDGAPYMALIWRLGDDPVDVGHGLVVHGTGPLSLGCNDDQARDNRGTIAVKVVRIE